MPKKIRAKTVPTVGKRALSGKTVVKLFTQEGVRELIIPSQEPNFYPVILSEDRFKNLKEHAAKVKFLDPVKERERLAELSQQRKAKFKEIDDNAAKNRNRRSVFDQEAKEKANYVLQRAWELRMEQEDEIKAANSLVLKTKCQAIRDAQLAEQKLIKKRLQEDELHIDKAMEEERLRKLIEDKREMEKRRCQREAYIQELNAQIGEMEEKKNLEFERTLQERQRLNKAMDHMMMEEVLKKKKAERQKAKTRRELAIANEQIRKAHLLEKEEARLADLKVQEWMRQRAMREEAQEKEQEEARRRKELETARLRAMQEKAGELQAQQEQMMAVRRQEEYEREWRRKEKEALVKKKEMDRKCLEVRMKQLNEMQQMQAHEIAREKMEFERIMEIQREGERKQKEAEERRKIAAKAHRENLLRQMNEKEKESIARRGDELAEGLAMRAEVAKRSDDIKKIMHKKVAQMRAHKVPELYVADIMRQLHLRDGE